MLGLGASLSAGATPPEFLPVDVDGIQLWLRNGVGVTAAQWDDSSGNARHATQSAEANQASVGGGGLDFEQSESDHYDLASAITISQDTGYACFLVCDIESYDSSQNCFLSSSSSKFLEFQTNDKIRLNYTNDVTAIFFDTQNLWNVATGKFLLTISRGDSGLHTVYKNGVSQTIDTSSSVLLTNPSPASVDTVGHRVKATPDRHFDGKIYELIVYNTSVRPIHIAQINNYLTSYHGL
tara:strand:- start:818 stop:1531 length:714 start_codon:yes stop_codon:yes gene_type:complete